MKTTPLKLTPGILAAAACLSIAALAASGADVAANWTAHCVSCHAKDGSGNTRMGRQAGAKDYRDAKVQAELKDDAGLKAIKDGVTQKGKEVMKPFAEKLSDADIKSLAAYVKTFKK